MIYLWPILEQVFCETKYSGILNLSMKFKPSFRDVFFPNSPHHFDMAQDFDNFERKFEKAGPFNRYLGSISNLGARHFDSAFFLKKMGAFCKNE